MYNLYFISSTENLLVYGQLFFVIGMIFVFFVLIFNPHFWKTCKLQYPVHAFCHKGCVICIFHIKRSGIFLHSSLILRFSCLRI